MSIYGGVCLIEVSVKSESTVPWVLRLTQSVSVVIQISGAVGVKETETDHKKMRRNHGKQR